MLRNISKMNLNFKVLSIYVVDIDLMTSNQYMLKMFWKVKSN